VSLVVRDLAVSFGGVAALGGVSFTVEPGTITSLIGPNGAGKTTAFNVITGYLPPTSGEVAYDDTPLTGLRPHHIARRGVVRTFQKTSLFPTLTAFENVMIGHHLHARTTLAQALFRRRRVKAEDAGLAREAAELLGFVGLARHHDTVASGMAYGEQRLLELAVALAARDDDRREGRDHPTDPESPRARRDRAPGRARHAARDGNLRPCGRPQLWQGDR
jgi:branched-chain amino acid transport system ATP-binding protein